MKYSKKISSPEAKRIAIMDICADTEKEYIILGHKRDRFHVDQREVAMSPKTFLEIMQNV